MENVKHMSAFATMLLIMLFAAPAGARAQLLWQDNFDYPPGPLYGHGQWVKYASNPNSPIQVVDRTLDFEGYPGGVKGRSVELGPDATAEDLIARFDPNDEGVKTGTLYYSALVNVEEVPSGPIYVMSLVVRTKSSVVADGKSGTELGRLYVDKADEEGKYRLGVERGASDPSFAPQTFSTGETYLVVVKYEIGAAGARLDGVSLFVNPASYTEEPAEADAAIDPNKSGSGVGNYGLQGIELRQGTSSRGTAPTMLVGSLRVADSYAGLFASGGGQDDNAPVITLSETGLDFNYVYSGDPQTAVVNVKGERLQGDISITVTGDELKPSVTTVTAEEAQSGEGKDVTFTLTPVTEEGKATVTFSTPGRDDVALEATWTTLPVKDIASLGDFAAENPDDYLTYRYTGEAVVTFVNNVNGTPEYYIQDATAGMLVKDDYQYLGSSYKAGDKLTGFIGNITSFFGAMSFVPASSTLGRVVSEGNTAEPVTVTLAAVKASPKTYVNRLVKIENATITGVEEGATFKEGMQQPTVTDATGEGKMRIFGGTSLIGKAVPSGTVSITGISTSAGAVVIAPRGADDITETVAAEPSLTVSPDKFDMAAGFVGKSAVVGTVHISAVNMPAPTLLEITGTDRKLFSLSENTIPAGTSEKDIVVTYSPTAIGKHSARLLIDCPEMPDVYRAITIAAYATDEQNPPRITVEPDAVPAFEAKVGETQEQTVTVTTAYLPDYAYMKMKEAGSFIIGTTMLMKNGKAEVKVTFAPKEAGDFENEIEIYSLAADTVRVKLKGKAVENTGTEPDKEGDDLPLDASNPLTLLIEQFDGVTKNKPLSVSGWKNLAMKGKRAWWGYEFPSTDESAGELAAKVTPYDSMTPEGGEEDCEMLLVTPPLDYVNSASKLFTFRVRGDYLKDNQPDKLELWYIDVADGDMFVSPVDGMVMPDMADQSGEWQEFHVDLSNQNIADVFFMGFSFKSTRGRNNSATYYIDDVSYGRTDLGTIRPSAMSLAFTAVQGKDAVSEEVKVTTANLVEPVTLTLGGPNKSKFKLSTATLPATGGSFTVSFNSDEIGVHEAYVKLSSRGAADIYVPVSVNNTTTDGIGSISAETGDIEIFDINGRLVRSRKDVTPAEAAEGLPAGVYVIKRASSAGITVNKVNIR